jgi:hypothetical protein
MEDIKIAQLSLPNQAQLRNFDIFHIACNSVVATA